MAEKILSDRMLDVERAIHTSHGWVKGVAVVGGVVVAIVGWWLTQELMPAIHKVQGDVESHNTRISTIEGQLKDLIPKTVDNLLNSRPGVTRDVLARNGQLATSVVASARQNRTPSNSIKLQESGQRLRTLLIDYPDVTELWGASGELASYRSETNKPFNLDHKMPDCSDVEPASRSNLPDLILKTMLPKPPEIPTTPVTPYIYRDCTLRLDDFAKLFEHELHLELGSLPRTPLIAPYVFERVLVIYSGGMLPLGGIEFKNCIFAVDLTRPVQDPKTRDLIFSLLTSDVSDIHINGDQSLTHS
jgi:hypothetical protein